MDNPRAAAEVTQTRGMGTNVTRLDPDLPLCWEDEETLRIGFERARARVRHPSAGAQRLIGVLRGGIAPEHLPMEARRVGATPQETRELLTVLRPALVTAPPPASEREPARPLRTIVCDEGREARGLRATLIASRLCTFDFEGEDPELVIVVERFLEPLGRAHRWLAAGVPHLLMRFTDQSVQVGPLVGLDGSPCHSCVTLAMLSRDPAYPTLAAQLYGVVPRSESDAGTHVAAAFAAGYIHGWLNGREEVHATKLLVPVAGGLVAGLPSLERVAPHPRCGCATISAADRLP